MVRLTALISITLLVCGISALPQNGPPSARPSAPPSTTASSTGGVPTGTLPKSVIDSLPIIPIEGNAEDGAVVQSSNSSLVEKRPDIVAAPNSPLPPVPSSNITRREECTGGFLGSPTTPWTNVLLVAENVCKYWFPDSKVFYVPVPLRFPGTVSVRVPLGPSFPTVRMSYRTRGRAGAVADLVTPLTSKICIDRLSEILAYARAPGHFNCAGGGSDFVHDGDDCDETTQAACFSFLVTTT